MSFTVTIPTWLLWVIGVPLAVVILALALLGGWVLWSFRNWSPLGW